MNLDKYTTNPFLKVTLTGKPGRLKSSCGLSFPSPMLIFDFDGKLEGPALWAKKMGIDVSKIDIESPRDWNHDWSKLEYRLRSLAKNPSPYKSFGFDSVTSIADTLLGFTADAKAKVDPNKVKRVGGVQVAGIDEYNAESSGVMDILLFCKDVQANTWLTAHIIETKTIDLESKRVDVSRQILTGGKKLAPKIPIYMPECYRIELEGAVEVGKASRAYCYTQANSEDDFARSAYPLPNKFEITDRLFYPTIISLIAEAVQRATVTGKGTL